MAKIGRNDACLCGSGKKFKKCCEATGQADRAARARAADLAEKARFLATALRGRPSPQSPPYVEDELDELSNSVVDRHRRATL